MTSPPRIAALVLAAGSSRRMGASNKLLEPLDGKPLVALAAEAALASKAHPVFLVTGHEAQAVKAALLGLDLRFVHNPDHGRGLSSSLRAGLAALPASAEACVILLGDMPFLKPSHIDRLIAAFAPEQKRAIIVPVKGGQRGNPTLWARCFFAEMMGLEGDMGGRNLITRHADQVFEVAMEDDAVLADIDTPDALAKARKDGGA